MFEIKKGIHVTKQTLKTSPTAFMALKFLPVQAGVRTVGTRGNLATMAEFRPRPSALPNFIQELSSTKALPKRGVQIKLFNKVQQSN